ncbi:MULTISPECIES: NapC/NirT family cytochrome c [unclassified Carboxylicivirga]|uniref:NapC/NirT family cytochrome c n=1 Tax=Carboxylicivirga TaxID=1628153 RepID=UPI003D34578F
MKKGVSFLIMLSILGVLLRFLFIKADQYTSTDTYCNSCHAHEHAHQSWRGSMHNDTLQCAHASCVDCHLPPKGQRHYAEKVKAGLRDLYAYHFKDTSEYSWKQRRADDTHPYTFKTSCIACHPELFPAGLSKSGEQAHWHYMQHQDEMHCIRCHTNTGHGKPQKPGSNLTFITNPEKKDTLYQQAATITGFTAFTETLPGSGIAFDMIAVDSLQDESPNTIKPFYMGANEVSWDEYLLFLSETEAEGRSENTKLDGISGATPPWGNPDQGWGLGQRPAITMTHHAATVYCQWLSAKTGKKYRLPTEAEWEYAATKAFAQLKPDTQYVNTNGTSTLPPQAVEADGIGARHLFGNVKEFCSDVYSKGSNEFVIKGGSFKSDPNTLSPSMREPTQHDNWLKTDPQIPKSIWWYSDCNDVGFRVVLSYPTNVK